MLVFIATPTLISLLVRKWLSKKGYPKIGNSIAIAVVAGTFYLVYIAIFPPASFYEDEFEQNIPTFTEITGQLLLLNFQLKILTNLNSNSPKSPKCE
jgi:hypothetical protein